MSTRRLVLTCALLALAISAGTGYIVRAFPLTAAAPPQNAPLEQQINPITPENPIPRRLSSVNPAYPAQYLGSGIGVWVNIRLVLDQSGAVADARVLSAQVIGQTPASNGDVDLEPFRAAALDAVRRWLYAPPANPPIAITAVFTFRESAIESSQGDLRFSVLERARGLASAAEALRGARRGGPVPAPGSQTAPTPGSRVGGSAAPGPGAQTAPSPGVIVGLGGPVRIGGNIRPPRQLHRVNPAYPPLALNARVQGVVILEVTVGADGRVSDARVVRSIPLLDQAAIEAVRQWEYEPILLNGVPVPATMAVTIQFMLPPEQQQPAN